MLKKDQGICIRTIDYSESSQILTLFTHNCGKISVIAKGARRAKSSFAGPIQLCTIGEMVFSADHADRLGTLTEFVPGFVGYNLRKKLFGLNFALFVCELLNLFMTEFDPHPMIFKNSVLLFENLEDSNNRKAIQSLILFELSLLKEVGSVPIFQRCANCQRKFDKNWQRFYFSSSANGLVCRDCESAFFDRKELSFEMVDCLNQSQVISNAETAILVRLQNLMIEYFTYILERPPRTAMTVLKLINSGQIS